MSSTSHDLRPAQDDQGLNASPQLPDGVKNYLIDIDGTIIDLGATGAADMAPGDAIVIRTPGGGGYGKP